METTDPQAVARQAVDEFAATTERMAGVPTGRARLIAALDQLDKAFDSLRENIDNILSDDRPADPSELETKAGMPEYSQHGNWLHEQAARIEEQATRIFRVNGRVDL